MDVLTRRAHAIQQFLHLERWALRDNGLYQAHQGRRVTDVLAAPVFCTVLPIPVHQTRRSSAMLPMVALIRLHLQLRPRSCLGTLAVEMSRNSVADAFYANQFPDLCGQGSMSENFHASPNVADAEDASVAHGPPCIHVLRNSGLLLLCSSQRTYLFAHYKQRPQHPSGAHSLLLPSGLASLDAVPSPGPLAGWCCCA